MNGDKIFPPPHVFSGMYAVWRIATNGSGFLVGCFITCVSCGGRFLARFERIRANSRGAGRLCRKPVWLISKHAYRSPFGFGSLRIAKLFSDGGKQAYQFMGYDFCFRFIKNVFYSVIGSVLIAGHAWEQWKSFKRSFAFLFLVKNTCFPDVIVCCCPPVP